MKQQVLVMFILASLISLSTCPNAMSQVPIDPAEPLQKMFEQFSKQSNAFMPGMFGEMTEEQRAKLAAIEISKKEEDEYGRKVIDQFAEFVAGRDIKIITAGQDIDYLKALADAIKPLMKNAKRYPKIDIRVVDTSEADAYSVPGGHLIFTTGLLESAGSEAALVGVVGHELAHLDRGHQLFPLKQSKALKQINNFQDGMMLGALMARPFRPEQETEADSDAVQWIMKLGYDPEELASLLMRWDAKQGQETPWMRFVPGFVKSHPNPGHRAQEVLLTQRQYSEKYPDAQYVGRENLRKRIAKSKHQFPE